MVSWISNNDNASVFWTGLGSALLRAAGGEQGRSRASLLAEGVSQLPAMLQQAQASQLQRSLVDLKLKDAQQEQARRERWDQMLMGRRNAMLEAGGGPTKAAAAMLNVGGVPLDALSVMGPETGAKMLAEQATKKPSSVQEYEYAKKNGYAGSFEDWLSTQGVGALRSPAAVQEYQYFSKLPKDEQTRYLAMKRANPYLNLGGEMVQPNPLVPGQAMGGFAKTLPPEEQPAVIAAQTAARKGAENTAAASAAAEKKAIQGASAVSLLEGVEDLIDRATGSTIGAGADIAARTVGKATEGDIATAQLKVLQANLMLNMPRMEGPQSDRDVNLYREAAGQIGDPTVPGPIKKAAVETIRKVSAKYQQGASKPAPKEQAISDDDLVKKYIGGR